jgi:hypothetical protein
MDLLSPITDRIADAIRGELRRQHAAIIAERDAAEARAEAAEAAASAARAAVLDLEAAIAGMTRGERDRASAMSAAWSAIPADFRPTGTQTVADAIRAMAGEIQRLRVVQRTTAEIAAADRAQLQTLKAARADPDRPTVAELQDERRAEDLAAVRAASASKSKPAPKSRTADRAAVARQAMRIACPTCQADPGKPCSGGKPHPERFGAARAIADAARARLTVRCPECDAPEGVPCVVDGRKGLHTARQVKP